MEAAILDGGGRQQSEPVVSEPTILAVITLFHSGIQRLSIEGNAFVVRHEPHQSAIAIRSWVLIMVGEFVK